MRAALIFIVAATLFSALAVAQKNEATPSEPKQSEEAGPLPTYVVEITEVHLSREAVEGLEVKELAQSLEQLTKDGHVDLMETVRLSVLAHHESDVMFGKQTAVLRGVVTTRDGQKQRSMTPIRVGTVVHVSAEPHQEDVLLKLKYEASRLGKVTSEDEAPDTESVNFTSDLLLRPGKPIVATASTTDSGTYLLVSIVK